MSHTVPAWRRRSRRLLTGAITATLAVGGLAFGVGAAHAEEPPLNPDWQIGELEFSKPTGSNLNGGRPDAGTASATTGAPASPTGKYCSWSSYLLDSSGTSTVFRSNYGLTAQNCQVHPTAENEAILRGETWTQAVNQGSWDGLLPGKAGSMPLSDLPTGDYRLVVVVFPRIGITDLPEKITDESEYRYWQYGLKWTQGATEAETSWKWVPVSELGGGTVVGTTTAVAVSDLTATSAKLTATVTPAAASGDVVFKHGETELGTGTLSGGVASITANLPAATSFAAGDIVAEYVGNTTHEASTGQAPAFSTAAASGTIGIGGSVPAASDPGVPSGLKLQIASGDVKLQNTQARVSGQSWTASGDTPNITVLDDRRNASAQAWTLNGRSSAFTDGAKEIAAAQLGWTPALVSAAETANLAAAVTGGVEGGLSTDKALATGPTPTTGVDVSAAVKANLALVVPSTAEAGQNYTATLTLTLI